MKKSNLSKTLVIGVAVVSTVPATSVEAISMNLNSENYSIDSLAGSNRYETAAMIASDSNKETVILVNADSTLSDGLSASGLSGMANAPILLVKKDTIPKETLLSIKNTKNAYIIGGKNTISLGVEESLNNLGIKTKRLEGKNRIETSIKVSEEIGEIMIDNNIVDSPVYLVNGMKGEADAMSIAPVAAKTKGQIILTNGKEMPVNVSTDIPTYAIGSEAVMSENILKEGHAERIGGKNRFETNKKVIEKFFSGEKEYYISKSDVLVDALTVSSKGKPVVFVSEKSDKSVIKNANKVTAIGGISDSIINQIKNILDEHNNL